MWSRCVLAFTIMEILQHLPRQPSARNVVLDRITHVYPILSRAERRVADFVLANPHALARTPISAITCGSGASAPTILRFCRSAGFTGLTDFKLALVAALGKKTDGAGMDPGKNDLPGAARAIVTRFFQRVPADEIAAAQFLISAACTVTCFATHDLSTASAYARDALVRHGIDARTSDGHDGAGIAVNAVGLFFCSGQPTAMLTDTVTRYHRDGKGAIVVGDMAIARDVRISVHIRASASSESGTHHGSMRLLPHLLVTDMLTDGINGRHRIPDAPY